MNMFTSSKKLEIFYRKQYAYWNKILKVQMMFISSSSLVNDVCKMNHYIARSKGCATKVELLKKSLNCVIKIIIICTLNFFLEIY